MEFRENKNPRNFGRIQNIGNWRTIPEKKYHEVLGEYKTSEFKENTSDFKEKNPTNFRTNFMENTPYSEKFYVYLFVENFGPKR